MPQQPFCDVHKINLVPVSEKCVKEAEGKEEESTMSIKRKQQMSPEPSPKRAKESKNDSGDDLNAALLDLLN